MKKTHLRRSVSALLICAMLLSLCGYTGTSIAAADADTPASVQRTYTRYYEQVYEAENAVGNGTSVNTDHTGYSGTGFVDNFNATGKYIDFQINIPVTGDYSFILRYANATGHKAHAHVYLDGEIQETIPLHALSDWNTWGSSELGATMVSAGTHTLRISFVDYAVNIDALTVEDKHESIRSLYLSNWKNMMAIWNDTKLCSEDTPEAGPSIREIRFASNWNQNQIKDYSGFFYDNTANKKYTSATEFNGEGYFTEDGTLRTNYLKYGDEYPDGLNFSRDYFMIPNKNVLVSNYLIENVSNETHTVSVLDMIHPNNTSTNSITANYNEELNAILIDMSGAGQFYMALGGFATPSAYQVANDAETSLTSATCSPWATFNSNATLKNNASASATDLSAALMNTVTIGAGETAELFYYVAIADSAAELTEICNSLRTKNGSVWQQETAAAYTTWFNNANTIPALGDEDLVSMYKRNLVLIKNCIRPGTTTSDGAMPATTNYYDYSYKVWTRDAATTVVALDAAGFYAEAEQYWKWMAARQLTGDAAGTYNTCINLWDNTRAEFIEPEHDSIGWFLYGVYRHCTETGDWSLADDIWTQVKASADFIMNSIDETGFGPKDFSIWEDMEHFGDYAYTQALYVAGLRAAAKMAEHKQLFSLADSYNGAASTILTAINRDDTDMAGAGLWYADGGYYDKLVLWNGTPDRLVDASAMLLFALGVVDIHSSRATSTIAKFEDVLLSDEYGMARYAYDVYYSDESPWSPSGDESLEVSPSWPQISFWNAICYAYKGNTATSLQILDWAKHRTGVGYMITGECVSDISEKPVVSTASEPVTAAAYILAYLTTSGNLDLRIYPDSANAGAYKQVDLTVSDNSQYDYIPYYCDLIDDSATLDLDIDRLYISNDASKLYIRVDNDGSIANTGVQCTVYCSDPSQTSATLGYTLSQSTLRHPAAYAFRYDNSTGTITKYTASTNGWQMAGVLTSADSRIDTSKGTIELAVPLSEIGVHSISTQSWFYASTFLGSASTGDSDNIIINYRTTSESDTWLYGNFYVTNNTEYEFGGNEVVYMVLTDRFSDGDTSNNGTEGVEYRPGELKYRQGGDWQGIIDNMDYIKNLGVTAIWISPPQANEPLSRTGDEAGYHGYYTKDYYSTDTHFGSLAKLKELINLAHSNGIKMIIDAVPNHTADYLEPFATAYSSESYMPAAPFNNAAWYHHNGDILNYDNYTQLVNNDMGGLDDLAQENPEVSNALIQAYLFWIKDVGFDAVRVDAASSIYKNFLSDFEKALGVATFGEVFNGNVDFVSDFQKYEWGVLDFPLFFAARDVFAKDVGFTRIKEILDQDNKYVNPQNLITFIDNHDRDRFLCVADDSYEKLRMALAFIFTVRGIPDVYYGTEQNLYGNGEILETAGIANTYNREMMSSFDQNTTTYKYVQRLSEIRKICGAFNNGTQREMWCSDTVYAFSRRDDGSGEEAFVVMNNGYSDATVTIPVRAESSYTVGTEMVNLLNTSQTVQIASGDTTGRQITITIPAKTTAILAHGSYEPYTEMTYTKTIIRVHYDAGLGNSISLRGSEYPLTWTAGVEMRNVSSDLWEYTIERYSDGTQVEFKPLLNDETWATGNNYTVTAGTTVDIYPTF